MASSIAAWLLIANVLLVTNVTEDVDIGGPLYRSMCAACHGFTGKGNGPLSGQLKVLPSDLTVLAKKNKGVFPVREVYEAIDGRKVIGAHGTREMPIWGAFNPQSIYPPDKFIDPKYDPEAVKRTRILQIIDYLISIQEY
jgi:mono/diheme cytochrome c family protein